MNTNTNSSTRTAAPKVRVSRSAQRNALKASEALMRQSTPLITAVLMASMRAELRDLDWQMELASAHIEAMETKGESVDYMILDRMQDRYDDIVESYAKYARA